MGSTDRHRRILGVSYMLFGLVFVDFGAGLLASMP
jgi:hypothetical protein